MKNYPEDDAALEVHTTAAHMGLYRLLRPDEESKDGDIAPTNVAIDPSSGLIKTEVDKKYRLRDISKEQFPLPSEWGKRYPYYGKCGLLEEKGLLPLGWDFLPCAGIADTLRAYNKALASLEVIRDGMDDLYGYLEVLIWKDGIGPWSKPQDCAVLPATWDHPPIITKFVSSPRTHRPITYAEPKKSDPINCSSGDMGAALYRVRAVGSGPFSRLKECALFVFRHSKSKFLKTFKDAKYESKAFKGKYLDGKYSSAEFLGEYYARLSVLRRASIAAKEIQKEIALIWRG